MKGKLLFSLCLAGLLAACQPQAGTPEVRTRADGLSMAIKVDPADDSWPPLAAAGWTEPAPMPGSVNTAGAEDSPFLSEDGRWFFFVFTPDASIPAQEQLFDGLTGIWVAQREGESWSEPQRVVLAEIGEVVLDGCPTLAGNTLYFCSARTDNYRDVDMFNAEWLGGKAEKWKNLGQQLNVDYGLGEMHVSADGRTIVFASQRPGGLGGYDLWTIEWDGQSWGAPFNLGAPVNTAGDENRPYLSSDGQELWYDGPSRLGYPGPAIFRSRRQPGGGWGEPEEIVSQFAGEPNLSADGSTLYFVHHYVDSQSGAIIEADIYVSYRLTPG